MMTVPTYRVAVPSLAPGGLDAAASEHFGHCDCFTLVSIVDGQIATADVIANPPHADCLGPVNHLADNGASALIVQGIGRRPLLGFEHIGIQVFGGRGATVRDLVTQLIAGQLPPVGLDQVCGGGGAHAH